MAYDINAPAFAPNPGATCGGCRHFDKSAWPDNPAFGICSAEFKLPPLPMWLAKRLPDLERPDGNARSVANYFLATWCQTWEKQENV